MTSAKRSKISIHNFKNSIKQSTGFLTNKTHGSTLPFIWLGSITKTQTDFLIDTGTTDSFIDPSLVPTENREVLTTPITIRTALNIHFVTEKCTISPFPQFKQNIETDFILFDFNP